MTEAEFRAWINANIKANGSKSVTGAIMNEFGMKCIEFFAHIDNPLSPKPFTIANEDLTALSFTANHALGTWLPDFLMQDENGDTISGEYFDAHPIDIDNTLFTFNAAIPATGNGYYKLFMWSVGLVNVPPRYINIFTSSFTDWTGDVPDGFTVEFPAAGNPTIEEDTDRALLTADGVSRVRLISTITLEIGREYRLSLNIISGNIRVVCGTNSYSLNSIGTSTITFTATATTLSIRNGYLSTALIDDLVIDEKA
jgi:hypothetical protein